MPPFQISSGSCWNRKHRRRQVDYRESIPRFYDPTPALSIDGVDIREFHLAPRDQIGYVLQETRLRDRS
jgi:hypothetical protein